MSVIYDLTKKSNQPEDKFREKWESINSLGERMDEQCPRHIGWSSLNALEGSSDFDFNVKEIEDQFKFFIEIIEFAQHIKNKTDDIFVFCDHSGERFFAYQDCYVGIMERLETIEKLMKEEFIEFVLNPANHIKMIDTTLEAATLLLVSRT